MSFGYGAAETGRWTAVCAAVIAAHAGAIIWLNKSESFHIQTAETPAIFVDLAPAPVPAPEPAAAPEPTPQPQPEPEIPEPQPVQQAEPEPAPSFQPPPIDLLEPPTEFPDVAQISALALAQSDRPQVRPPKPQPKRQPQAQASQPKPAEPRQAATRAAPAAPAQQNRAAPSPQPARQAAPSGQAIRQWQAEVGRRIARHMQRTRLRGRIGTASVNVAVSVGANGAVNARLNSSTGNPQADAALSRQASRMPRMPAPPAGQPQSLVLPIRIQ